MNVFESIGKLMENDSEHFLKMEVSWDGIAVYLDYDPALQFEENCVIPIRYTAVERFAYIPDTEYREMFNPNDFGIEENEITLIKNIMDCLNEHGDEIQELCNLCDLSVRQEKLSQSGEEKENNIIGN